MRRPALALILGCLLLVAGVSALDGYDYYQTIEYAACDQEIYQQDIIIHRTTGTAYNETAGGLETWHIYVGEHCREDYGDIRFTNSTGELAYYLWPDYDSSSARFAVRLEGADQSGALTVWYGNAGAATTSNGDGTYFLFDNFDEDTLNTTKWTSTGSISISGGILTISNAGKIQSTGTFGNKHTFMARAKVAPVSQNWVGWLNTPSGTFAIFQYTTSSRCHVYFTSDSNNAAPINFSGEFHTFEIRRGPSTIFLIDGGNSITIAQSSTAQIRATCEICSGTQTMLLDWVAVRAYSATPPAATTFSGEQETATPPMTPIPTRPRATEPIDNVSTSLVDDLINSLGGETVPEPGEDTINWTGLISTIGGAYTSILGPLAYTLIFSIPFLMMWITQRDMTLPGLVGALFGLFIIVRLPAEFHLVAVTFIVISIVAVIYSLVKERV